MTDKEASVQHFHGVTKKSKRGIFENYTAMSAGVGKTYRMLQEAKASLKNGIDIRINKLNCKLFLGRVKRFEALPDGLGSLENVLKPFQTVWAR